MRVLWFVNIPLPEASLLMNEAVSPFGGWLVRASEELANQEGIELSIAFPQKGVNAFAKMKGRKITYYAFRPVRDNDRRLIDNNVILNGVLDEVQPDIVHIHGTELAHTLAAVNACKRQNRKVVISIQGVVSLIAAHVRADLPWRVVHGFTVRNLVKRDSVIGLQRLYRTRGRNEIEAIAKSDHVIGRTTWDRAWSQQVHPNVQYHLCNESLRSEFYKHRWSVSECERHSIFVSQGQYPAKGLHYAIEAMPLILQRFPDCKIYVGGRNMARPDTLRDRILMTYYGKYIGQLMREYGLEENVVFTGLLGEQGMCNRYLKSNVFVCPSSIENSPNSLGEAMILGVPCVASYVGGIPDMLTHESEGFMYQANAPHMLAHYVCEIFQNDDLAASFSENARARALRAHCVETNTARLLEIYGRILSE